MNRRSGSALAVGGLAVLAIGWFVRMRDSGGPSVPPTPVASHPAAPEPGAPDHGVPETVRTMIERVAGGEFPEEMVDRSADFRALRGEAKDRAADNPAAALAWALALPPDDAPFAARQVLDRWTAVDPAAALDAAEAIDGTIPGLRDQAVVGVLSGWAGSDPAAAWGALAAVEPPEVRTLVQAQIGISWALADPAAAADALHQASDQAGDGGDVTHLLPGLGAAANSLAAVDAEGAVAWASTLPANATRPAMVGAVMRRWADTDPLAASTWLAEQEPGNTRDAGAEAIAQAITQSDPERAAVWAQTIAEPARRSAALAQVAATWLQIDRPAAETYLNESPDISPEQRQAVLAVQDAIDTIPR
ncbi:hypothetical protein BH23VER1_BH23VER1_19920 [soil metagenome]